MVYELWYEDTGNIIDAYATEDAALAEVRAFIEDYGPSSVDTMALLAAPQGKEKYILARGSQLVAYSTATTRSRSAAM